MRAIVVTGPGGPEVLEVREVADPRPQRGEVLVRVRATAVNRADLLQRMGLYPAPPGAPADILGLEIAGEVEALGDDVTELGVGDRVFGVVGGGGYAERIVVHARTLARMPDGLAFTDAAAIPEAFMTAWDALHDQAGLGPGETALVHAVGSGVGTAAVQIVRALGARCLGTARSADKIERARGLGLEDGIVVDGGRFADAVRARTDGRGVDVVLELVGGGYVAEDVACAAERARIVVVGLLAGPHTELDLGAVLRRRISIVGTVLRSRPLEEKIAATRSFARHVVPLLARGTLRPVVDAVLPLEGARAAHERVAKSDTFGKLVLELG